MIIPEPRKVCENCQSKELEEWAESGHYWMHCHHCEYDHDDHFVK